jgi:CelD/BcsL family acetyltransferase involved in cellulose biosynthesis
MTPLQRRFDVTTLTRVEAPRVQRGALSVHRITDVVGLHAVRSEWTELLRSSPSDCIFLTWEWLSTWWKHLGAGRRLDLVAVRKDDELIGLAPLMVTPMRPGRALPCRARQFLGSGSVGSDYLDVIVKAGWEDEALGALAARLGRDGIMVDLAQLNRRSAAASLLADRLERLGWHVSEQPGDVCPFIELAGHTWASFLQSLGGRHRYNVKHRLDKLVKQRAMRFHLVQSEDGRREALAALVALHRKRWSARGGSTALDAPSLVGFHEEFSRLALERGWLRLFVMYLGGEPVAALYGFRYRGTFYFYQTGFDPTHGRDGVGQATVGLTIQHAIEEGCTEYDMLHGDEPYKFDWAGKVRELERLQLYPGSARGWACRQLVELDRAARKAARRLLPTSTADWITRRTHDAI